MNNFFTSLDNLSAKLGINTMYFHVLFKALAAIAGTYIVWFILIRIIASLEKKTKKTKFSV